MIRKYPQYYDVDDIPVMLFVDPKTGFVAAVNDLGRPADLTAPLEGRNITEAEFRRMAAERAKTLNK